MIGDIIVGIDVGPSKVCCCLGQINKFNQVEILSSSTATCDGFKKGKIVSSDSIARAIRFAISDIESENDFIIKSAYINIVGRHTAICRGKYSINLENKYDGVTQKNIDEIIRGAGSINIPEGYQIIDVVPVKFVTDTKVTDDPIGIFTNTLSAELDIILAEKPVIKQLSQAMQKAGLKVDGIVLNGFTKKDIILTSEEREKGVLLLDVGSGGIDISVFENGGILYSDYLSIGGDTITNDISLVLDISYEEAEKLKKQYGLADVSFISHDYNIKLTSYKGSDPQKSIVKCSDLVSIISARVRETLEIIKKSLEDNELTYLIKNCVISGSGYSSINKIDKLTQTILNMDVRIGNAKTANMIKPDCITAYGVVKYISNIKYSKKIGSKIQIEEDQTFISSTMKSIKKAFCKLKN